MSEVSIWSYASGIDTAVDLTGFSVEALDGSIGKVDRATGQEQNCYLVVDTGPWIFGKSAMVPAGVVERIDPESETVYVARTKEQIKNAPDYDEARVWDEAYKDEFDHYYCADGVTPPPPNTIHR